MVNSTDAMFCSGGSTRASRRRKVSEGGQGQRAVKAFPVAELYQLLPTVCSNQCLSVLTLGPGPPWQAQEMGSETVGFVLLK